MDRIAIAIDAMGGDHGVSVTVPAAIDVVRQHPHCVFYLVGQQDLISQTLQEHKFEHHDQLKIIHADEVVGMDELPASSLRTKKKSSMRIAINMVHDKQVQACVSAGNTGALMATSRFVLKTLPGIDRPAIIATYPTMISDKIVYMLDLGANVDCEPLHLQQFALMGSILVSAVDARPQPTIGLLNVGVEHIKGNELVKKSAELLMQMPELNYIGFVEADQIFEGGVDVVVCDGFVGNIALKTMEGVAQMLRHYAEKAFHQNLFSKITGLLAKPVLRSVRRQIDPANYNGACLIGLQGTVIKSHGGTKRSGFANAIHTAINQAQKNIPERIANQLSHWIKQEKIS